MNEVKAATPAATETAKRGKLVPVTVRFSGDAWKVLHDVADEHNITTAELIRYCVDNRLANYLRSIEYVDAQQGAAMLSTQQQIRDLLAELGNEMAAIKFELHRIGVNFNQDVRRRNIEQKYKGAGFDLQKISAKQKELQAIDAECKGFDPEQLEQLLARYEQATAKVGDALCRIVE